MAPEPSQLTLKAGNARRDLAWIRTGPAAASTSIREFAQASFETYLPPDAASLLFGLLVLLLLFLVNLVCWRRRWFLKL